MKGRLYANWLVIITLFLFFSSLGIFVISLKDTIGIKQCAFGDDLGTNCICNSEGEKVCDEDITITVGSSEFTSVDLVYSFDFLNLIDINNPINQKAKFVDISNFNNNLKITLEIESMCNEDSIVAPQIGFYKLNEEKLILTVVSNLTNESFNMPCVSENTFLINNFNMNVDDTFRVQYQDEYDSIYLSNNCIYEGYIRNDGDVYNSKDGNLLCQCKNGESSCVKE